MHSKRRREMYLVETHNHRLNAQVGPSPIFIREGDLHVRTITSQADTAKAQKLRHAVFAEELGWVQGNEEGLEIDDYDQGAFHFGVFDRNENLKAYLRIVTSENSYMLEKAFPFLVFNPAEIRKERDTVEVSRLCVAPEARTETFSGNFGVHTATMLLYKGVYHWCLKNRKQYIYLVVEQKVFRLLGAKGFPCRLVGEPKAMPDGVVAVAAILDWREFERRSSVRGRNVVNWFSQYQSALPTVQLPGHGYDLRRQA
jgi:acyl homoserine lactone synthase